MTAYLILRSQRKLLSNYDNLLRFIQPLVYMLRCRSAISINGDGKTQLSSLGQAIIQLDDRMKQNHVGQDLDCVRMQIKMSFLLKERNQINHGDGRMEITSLRLRHRTRWEYKPSSANWSASSLLRSNCWWTLLLWMLSLCPSISKAA